MTIDDASSIMARIMMLVLFGLMVFAAGYGWAILEAQPSAEECARTRNHDPVCAFIVRAAL